MKLLTNYTKTFFKYRRKLFYSFEREYASDIAGALGTNHSKNANKLNLLFFGSDQFSVPSLSLLHEKRFNSIYTLANQCNYLSILIFQTALVSNRQR